MNRATRYALGLLVEEMGEALCHIGRALRFGINTFGQDGVSERDGMARELGDVRAAIDFAGMNNVYDLDETFVRRSRKLSKLTDPSETDNLGRRLAPQSGDFLKAAVDE
jgi:hypothetical protein